MRLIFCFYKKVSCCFLATMLCFFSLLGQGDSVLSVEKKHQKIDSLFHSLVEDNGFNGVFLVSYSDGKDTLLYKNVSGYADFNKKILLTRQSQFEIASVSKQFTAVAILQLYEENKLKLEDLVSTHIPDFPYSKITIHQLLCHQSKLPDYLKFTEIYHGNKNYPLSNDSLLKMLQKHSPKLLNLPDNEFKYSNTGYVVLANIVEKITGKKFSQYLQDELFLPAGMTQTFLYSYSSRTDKMPTIGHRSNKNPYYRDFQSGTVGDKGIFSTVDDLFCWQEALFGGKILKPETLALAVEQKCSTKDSCENYAYGFRIGCDELGQKLIYHGGLWNGNSSLFIYRPVDNAVIIILSNLYNKSFLKKSEDIFRILDDL